MQQELLIAILAGLGGMIGWGSADFFAKKTIDHVGSIVSLVWAHMIGTSILILIVIAQIIFWGKWIYVPQNLWQWAGLIFFGTLQMIVYFFVYEGFGKGQLAVLNPVFASFTGLVALVSILFLGEPAPLFRVIALFVIFVGVILVSLDLNELRLRRIRLDHVPGLKEVGMGTILAAVWTLSWSRFVSGQDWLSFALFMYAFMTIAAYVLSRFMKVKLEVVKSNLLVFLLAIGIGEVIAYLAISMGYSATSLTSVVALISGAFSLPTIVLARIFLKEKVATVQTIGSLVIIAGIIILSLR